VSAAATPQVLSHRLVMRAELAQLSRLTTWAEDFAQRRDLPPSLSFAIQLCIEEAVANIIMYSGAAQSRQEIAVELVMDRGDLLAIIEGGGAPFGPTAAPLRVRPSSIDDAPSGQLGIHLMRNYASEMRYERRAGRNRLTLRFQPSPAATGRA